MKKKWYKYYAWFIFICANMLLACDPGAFVCGPALIVTMPITMQIDKSYDEYCRRWQSENMTRYADKNKDGVLDRTEVENLLVLMGYTKKFIDDNIPQSAKYCLITNRKLQENTLNVKYEGNQYQVIISEQNYNKLSPQFDKMNEDIRNKEQSERLAAITQFTDKNADGKIDYDELVSMLHAANTSKLRMRWENLESCKERYFELKETDYEFCVPRDRRADLVVVKLTKRQVKNILNKIKKQEKLNKKEKQHKGGPK